jgi:hypothetical protein
MEAATVSAKTPRAMMTKMSSLAREKEGVDWNWGAVGVLALGSCSSAR